jgi:hypothetical protein
MPLTVIEEPWYKEGLRFDCTQCGKCCTGSPGYVWVNEEEIARMAEFLKISPGEFRKKYTRQAYGRVSLIEDKRTYDCVFLEGRTCKLYDSRPRQCRTFPWWPQNLSSRAAWEETAARCEGINKDAPLVSLDTIQEAMERSGQP